MAYFVFVVLGMLGGGFSVYILLETVRRGIAREKSAIDAETQRIDAKIGLIDTKQKELDLSAQRVHEAGAELDRRIVSYNELEHENSILKRDIHNLDISTRKLKLDQEQQEKAQQAMGERSTALASIYLKENVKWIGSNLNANNYAASKERLQKVIERCNSIGFRVSVEEEARLFGDLKKEYELVVRAAFEKEEQARIRSQIREEQQREREIQRELQQIDREREAIAAALARALAEAHDEHSVEVEGLRARLAEAEERSQRAMSQAQLTKAGHVYVISNIGAFGEGVFKIGMTRRLDPHDRVAELSGASVPFPFDVHMMISCDNAPSMENALHRRFHKSRINKANPKKEFFKAALDDIVEVVREQNGDVSYVADAEALQYRQSLSMSDEDQEFIEGIYDDLEDEAEVVGENS